MREVERFAAAGVLEMNLVSQDTIAYGRDLADGDARAARRAPHRGRARHALGAPLLSLPGDDSTPS